MEPRRPYNLYNISFATSIETQLYNTFIINTGIDVLGLSDNQVKWSSKAATLGRVLVNIRDNLSSSLSHRWMAREGGQ